MVKRDPPRLDLNSSVDMKTVNNLLWKLGLGVLALSER